MGIKGNSMILSQFKIELTEYFLNMTLTGNEQPKDEYGHASPQMKETKFLSLKYKHRNILLTLKIKNIEKKLKFWLGGWTVLLFR